MPRESSPVIINTDNNELKFVSEFQPAGVIMLDGLRQSDIREAKTGAKIFDHIRDLNEFRADKKKIICLRHVVGTTDALRVRLRTLVDEFPENFAFILHLECHASQNFIEIGDAKQRMTWREFMQLLRPLNTRNKCNVGVVLACCDGSDSFKVDSLADPVPFYFQLSHRGRIYPPVLESSLKSFYEIILNDHDLPRAIRAAEPFKIKYAEEIFARLIYAVLHYEPRRKSKQKSVNRLLSALMARGGVDGIPELAFNRSLAKKYIGTFEQQIASCIRDNMSFFCGRTPAFGMGEMIAWIAGGQTLSDTSSRTRP